MENVAIFFNFIFPIALLALGLFVGKFLEKKHYEKIHKREKLFLHKPAITSKNLSADDEANIENSTIATGSVVVSVDHFKRLLMTFRCIFGGEVRSYSSLLDRGRREAILRMKETCPDADVFLNCRLETAALHNGQGKSIGCVEVLAYSTAVTFRK